MRSPQFLHVAQQPETPSTHDAAVTFAALPPVRTVKLSLEREGSIDTRVDRSRVPQALVELALYGVASVSARQTIPNGDVRTWESTHWTAAACAVFIRAAAAQPNDRCRDVT
jgi:hypothetical protein